MKKVIVVLFFAGILLITACNGEESNTVESVDGIVGTWNRVGGEGTTICQYSDDGTNRCARSLEQIDIEPLFVANYWFEDGKYFEQTDTVSCSATGSYEIILRENGNLKFELIEDECSNRKSGLIGSVDEGEGTIEWEPLP